MAMKYPMLPRRATSCGSWNGIRPNFRPMHVSLVQWCSPHVMVRTETFQPEEPTPSIPSKIRTAVLEIAELYVKLYPEMLARSQPVGAFVKKVWELVGGGKSEDIPLDYICGEPQVSGVSTPRQAAADVVNALVGVGRESEITTIAVAFEWISRALTEAAQGDVVGRHYGVPDRIDLQHRVDTASAHPKIGIDVFCKPLHDVGFSPPDIQPFALQLLNIFLAKIEAQPSPAQVAENDFLTRLCQTFIGTAVPDWIAVFEPALFPPFTEIPQGDIDPMWLFNIQSGKQFQKRLHPRPCCVVARDAAAMVEVDQHTSVLGIVQQRLVPSKANDGWGFDLWQSVMLHVPLNTPQPYFRQIVVTLLTRMHSHRLLSQLHPCKGDSSVARASLRPVELWSDEVLDGVTELIGITPLVWIDSPSNGLGVEILGKAEQHDPPPAAIKRYGSVVDRNGKLKTVSLAPVTRTRAPYPAPSARANHALSSSVILALTPPMTPVEQRPLPSMATTMLRIAWRPLCGGA
ncbi:hypothetical protein BJV78DRAFT_1155677 [Lactifluus subvellereus]|nr:hypothetical protein BJV78DRAFT_1155677 [Lactifluus subvellereus]